jgi:hypothetical protein
MQEETNTFVEITIHTCDDWLGAIQQFVAADTPNLQVIYTQELYS